MANAGTPEFRVIEVNISDINLSRDNRLGFIISQPLLQLETDTDPPFRISDSCRTEMMEYLTKAIAEAEALQVSSRVLIFPEYSVPSDIPDGVSKLVEWIQQGPNDTVVIAGLERLDRTGFDRIGRLVPSLKVNIEPHLLSEGRFANCCLILLKTSNGVVNAYLQAKLRPSEPEALTLKMVFGDSVFFFRTERFNFLVLICFDLIGSEANRMVIDQLIGKLGACSARADESIHVHAVINIQHNDKPRDENFTNACVKFLRPSGTLDMANGLAVLANSASPNECSHGMFGRTRLVSQSNRWKFPVDEPNLYFTYKPNHHVQMFEFRRRTGGIFAFSCYSPAVNTGASGDPRIPLENGRFWLRDSSTNEWRDEVTEALPLKLRDYLCTAADGRCYSDFINRLDCRATEVQGNLTSSYQSIRSTLISMSRMRVREICQLLLCHDEDSQLVKVDDWKEDVQGAAIRELAISLSILSLASNLILETTETTTATDDQRVYAIIDGNNTQPFIYADALYNRYRDKFPKPTARNEPRVFVIANRFVGGAMPETQPEHFNRSKSSSSENLQHQPSKRTMKVISANDLHTAQFCESLGQAVGVLRSHLG